jgi:hypothetical protein
MNEVCNDVEIAVDFAFSESKFVLDFYSYLKTKELKRVEAEEFLKSKTVLNLETTIKDLEEYLEGGSDPLHVYLREAYGHLSKPLARKIKNYLEAIITDTKNYVYDKRPGRRPKAKDK